MCPSPPLTAAMASNCRGDTKPVRGGGRKQQNACDAHDIIPCTHLGSLVSGYHFVFRIDVQNDKSENRNARGPTKQPTSNHFFGPTRTGVAPAHENVSIRRFMRR